MTAAAALTAPRHGITEVPAMHAQTTTRMRGSKDQRVIVAAGYGIRIRVNRNQLVIDDGFGRQRQTRRFARALLEARRLVILGSTGYVTFDALQWLRDRDVAVVQLGDEGAVLLQQSDTKRTDAALRRSQALAAANGVGLEITRNLIAEKIARQSAVLEKHFPNADQINMAVVMRLLDETSSIDEIRTIEAMSAAVYWNAWPTISLKWAKKDLKSVPDHWIFKSRTSPLSESPNRAIDPINAVLNYLYQLLTVETANSIGAAGLDRGLGILHADQGTRDSLALDLMEPVRPQVDSWLLGIISSRTFAVREFFERRDGVCRLMPELAKAMAQSMSEMRTWVDPIVSQVVASLERKHEERATPIVRTIFATDIRISKIKPPKQLKQQKQRRRIPVPLGKLCRGCGVSLTVAKRSFCENCIDEHTEESVRSRIVAARSRRDAMRTAGTDPVKQRDVRAKIGTAIGRRNREAAEWLASGGVAPPREIYLDRIFPKLQKATLDQIQEVTGLSNPYCSRIRSGKFVPHPRHWDALARLS